MSTFVVVALVDGEQVSYEYETEVDAHLKAAAELPPKTDYEVYGVTGNGTKRSMAGNGFRT